MTPTLVQTLPAQPLAIIGDIHGESTALNQLLHHLDQHPETRDRLLIFIGDLCDRGPDSVGAIAKVQALVESGRALAILGNHEINLLAHDAKDGSGWFFDSRAESDAPFYAPFTRASASQRPTIRAFLSTLPLAIRTPDLRIVHASWDPQAIAEVESQPCGSILSLIRDWDVKVSEAARQDDLDVRYQHELKRWGSHLEDRSNPPPYLEAVAQYESLAQRINPIKKLTSGIEARCEQPFFSGNRWRYCDRTPWWNDDDDPTPVVIGHYWRLLETPAQGSAWRYARLFDGVAPDAWHGKHHQAFCVDYSVGARWSERHRHVAAKNSRFHLAALLWPERRMILDDGRELPTH